MGILAHGLPNVLPDALVLASAGTILVVGLHTQPLPHKLNLTSSSSALQYAYTAYTSILLPDIQVLFWRS